MPRPIANRDDRQHPGTSTNTPTTVAKAAPDSGPYSAIAVATASSKKLLAPISAIEKPSDLALLSLKVGISDKEWNDSQAMPCGSVIQYLSERA
jgi:hypothetical protein